MTPSPSGRAGRDRAVFGLPAVAVLGVTVLCASWVHLDGSWPHDDDFALYQQAVCIAERLPSTPGLATTSCAPGTPYPPLVPLVAALFFLVAGGPSLEAALQTQSLWTALLAASVAWMLGGGARGALAALIAPALLFLAGIRNSFYTEAAMAALGALALAGVVRSEGRPLPAAVAGLAAGLGLLSKWSFAFFLGPPMLLAFGAALVRRRWAAAAAMLAGAAIAAPWYATMGPKLRSFLEANLAGDYSGDRMALGETWPYYPAVLATQVGVVLLLMALPGLRARSGRQAGLALMSGLILLSAAPYRTGRYLAPAMPWLAPMIAAGPMPVALVGGVWALVYQCTWLTTLPALDLRIFGPGGEPFPPGNTRRDVAEARAALASPRFAPPLASPIPFYDPPAADLIVATLREGGARSALVLAEAGPMEMALATASLGGPRLELRNLPPGQGGAALAASGEWIVEVRGQPAEGPDPVGEARAAALLGAGYRVAWERRVAGPGPRIERVWAPR